MTAIRLAVLKQESASLTKYFDQPDSFVREFHRLLDRYADRTHRMGQAGEPTSILPSYNVPAPVMRQIFRDMRLIVQTHPEEILILCDKLWSQAYFELRSLAAFLLGQISLDSPEPITRRITEWGNEVLDERMVSLLLDYGLARMRLEAQEEIYALAETWLATSDPKNNKIGIRVLITLIEHPTAEDIPLIFRLTTPLIRLTDKDVRPDVLRLWKILAHSIPNETAYHLLQNLKSPSNPDTRWFIRHLIHSFPKGIQDNLRGALKDTNEI